MAGRDLETIDCPVCTSGDFDELFVKAQEQFSRCARCGLVLINPRPQARSLAATYDTQYSEFYVTKAEKKRRRVGRWVERIQRRYVDSGRWMDVGCSAGFVVEAAAQRGFDAYGVDVEAGAIRHARDQLRLDNVFCGALEQQDFAPGFFDVISLYDVIEHVPDLNATVATVARLLKADGVIEIRTPDVGHFRVPRDLASWSEIKPSEHLYYFDRGTLDKLMRKHGLAITARRFSFKPGLKVYIQHAC